MMVNLILFEKIGKTSQSKIVKYPHKNEKRKGIFQKIRLVQRWRFLRHLKLHAVASTDKDFH